MALTYSRLALNGIFSSTFAKPLCLKLWRNLSELHIARRKPTRRGHRAGQRKKKQIGVCLGNREQEKCYHPSFTESFLVNNTNSFEDLCLHISARNSLNIQSHTFSSSQNKNRFVVDCAKRSRSVTQSFQNVLK